MDVKLFDLFARRVAEQTLLHGQNDLRNHFQIAVHEHIERVRDDAFGGILDGYHAVIRAVFADLGKDVADGFQRRVKQAGAKFTDGRLVRERGLGTEIGDGHGLFQ